VIDTTPTIDRLLVATKNAHKVGEFRELLAAAGGRAIVEDLTAFPGAPDVDEDGASFLENACLKAAGYARFAGRWALADDSGLAVDALGGKPGIFSARWASSHNEGEGDDANNRLLRKQLRGVPDEQRTARFLCALALANPRGDIILTCQGSVEGRILTAARGRNGFGYDPLFMIDAMNQTAAQLEPAQKHAISHRGQAMRRMTMLMRENGLL
jgi:XTP/dITP diphosphohydrolase